MMFFRRVYGLHKTRLATRRRRLCGRLTFVQRPILPMSHALGPDIVILQLDHLD